MQRRFSLVEHTPRLSLNAIKVCHALKRMSMSQWVSQYLDWWQTFYLLILAGVLHILCVTVSMMSYLDNGLIFLNLINARLWAYLSRMWLNWVGDPMRQWLMDATSSRKRFMAQAGFVALPGGRHSETLPLNRGRSPSGGGSFHEMPCNQWSELSCLCLL